MFVYSIKGNTLKLVGVICAAAILMVVLLVTSRGGETATETVSKSAETQIEEETAPAEDAHANEIRYDKIRSNSDRVKFLSQFGWEVEERPVKEGVVRIPKEFDELMNSYNNVQRALGLDLENYAGREVERYSYRVTNYPDYSGEVFANILVFHNKVIGGDVCSYDVDGFIRDFSYPGNTSPETEAPETEAPETEAETSS